MQYPNLKPYTLKISLDLYNAEWKRNPVSCSFSKLISLIYHAQFLIKMIKICSQATHICWLSVPVLSFLRKSSHRDQTDPMLEQAAHGMLEKTPTIKRKKKGLAQHGLKKMKILNQNKAPNLSKKNSVSMFSCYSGHVLTRIKKKQEDCKLEVYGL